MKYNSTHLLTSSLIMCSSRSDWGLKGKGGSLGLQTESKSKHTDRVNKVIIHICIIHDVIHNAYILRNFNVSQQKGKDLQSLKCDDVYCAVNLTISMYTRSRFLKAIIDPVNKTIASRDVMHSVIHCVIHHITTIYNISCIYFFTTINTTIYTTINTAIYTTILQHYFQHDYLPRSAFSVSARHHEMHALIYHTIGNLSWLNVT